MSGIIGHTMYAILGAKAAAHRELPVAPLISRHWASYLAGSYLGCDIQTMPEAICVDTGKEVGYGTAPLTKSPITGGDVRPFFFQFEGRKYRPGEIHSLFYGRAHVTFGWTREEKAVAIPWQHLPDYCAAIAEDAIELFGPGERPLAYALGWTTHLIGDGLIKSIWPGVTLELLDGKYTSKNRPIQDLVTFHEVGKRELQVNWPAIFADLVATPVEPLQVHFMRVGGRQGRLGRDFPNGWEPTNAELLHAVLAENRRYLKIWTEHVLRQVQLKQVDGQPQCCEELQQATGGLSYTQMVETAQNARFRHALWQIAEAIADLFSEMVDSVPQLRRIPGNEIPAWPELTERWIRD